ncbi:ketopantoate reductase [Clostridium folliculivorans]|uniref:Ketopantoate reductase n=1 Tax=Clostridium folliculivorans TaxID=2886038 RepID=A0A9W5Y0G7_9CLOT|nr:2-dehydropantoate 2-reductase N-terminal domain-containing protein [Clostridium folliculivorans]GKU24459.1 ketopantoate reductase [Clostridium folliculivorans]
MKILMIGRGVISTQYGWALEQAGNDITFYVRPGRIKQYGDVVNMKILDGRKNRKGDLVKKAWKIKMIEKISSNHDFDLIMISVNHNQLSNIINLVESLVNNSTVLIFNNIIDEPLNSIGSIPKEQVVWGFPGAGGSFINQNTLDGGFMKNIFMGSIDNTTNKNRYDKVANLFKNAGFGISENKDMRNWLWFHFITNVSLMAAASKVGSLNALFDSTSALKEFALILRELIPLMDAKGSKLSSIIKLGIKLPAGLIAFVMKLALAEGQLPREIMRSASGSESLKAENNAIFVRDALAEARRLGISIPRLEALDSYVYKQFK